MQIRNFVFLTKEEQTEGARERRDEESVWIWEGEEKNKGLSKKMRNGELYSLHLTQ
jgi:hypothetical protein